MVTDAFLIAGATASGKTKHGIALAKAHGASIINTDSMQVYDGLQIISARPDADELAQAPHHLFGHVCPSIRYSTGQWLRDVTALLKELPKPWIFLGGTGLYFEALMGGLSSVPEVPQEIVDGLEARLSLEGLEVLRAELRAADPELCASLPVLDAQRTVRGLSVLAATGKPLSYWQSLPPLAPVIDVAKAQKLVLLPEREVLYGRINARVDKMLEQGALNEVEAFLERNLDPSLPAMRAIGVKELGGYLKGDLSLEDAKAQMAMHTRRYAKRQMTWIRNRMGEWEWI